MRLEALKHLSEVALAMLGAEGQLIVVGSSSLLSVFPELGLKGSILETSFNDDVIPEPFTEEIGIMLREALGEDRRFHQINGYCLDVRRPMIGEQFPEAWEDQCPLP